MLCAKSLLKLTCPNASIAEETAFTPVHASRMRQNRVSPMLAVMLFFWCFRQCIMSYLSYNAYCIVRAPDYRCHIKCPRLIASCIAHHVTACLSPEQPEAVFPHVIFFFPLRLCMSGITHSSSWHCRRLVWHLQWCCSLRSICACGHTIFCSLTCIDTRCSLRLYFRERSKQE